MTHFDYLALLIGGATLAVAVVYMRRTIEQPTEARFRMKEVMSPEEVELFNLLRRALPNHHVFPKLATRSLISIKPGTGGKESLDRLNTHVCDFAIYTRHLRLECIVELEKQAYRPGDDPMRDVLHESGRVNVWRFDPRNLPATDQISRLVLGHDDVEPCAAAATAGTFPVGRPAFSS
jgi:hypothetical protein